MNPLTGEELNELVALAQTPGLEIQWSLSWRGGIWVGYPNTVPGRTSPEQARVVELVGGPVNDKTAGTHHRIPRPGIAAILQFLNLLPERFPD